MATKRNEFVGRIFKENASLDELIRDVKISGNTISYHINCLPELFTYQRIPFYNVSALDRLSFIMGITNEKLMTNLIKSKDLSQRNTSEYIPRTALLSCSFKLHMIQASHPTYIESKCFVERKESKSRPGLIRSYTIQDCKLYDNNSWNRKLICNYKFKGILLTQAEAQGIANARKPKKVIILSRSMAVSEFPFASPWNVGESAAKCVFLSNLEQVNGSLSANGLIRLENGFDAHPWSSGSGDHINSRQSLLSFMQFIHAMLRNSDKIKKNERVDDRFFEIEDKECALTAVECNLNLRKFVELGQYMVELIKLKMVDPSLYGKRLLFAMEISMKLTQEGEDCVVAQLVVAPIFTRSKY